MAKKQQKMLNLNNISIGLKLILLLAIPITILIIVGILAVGALNQSDDSLQDLQLRVENVNTAGKLLDLVNNDYQQTLNEINNGILTWGDGRDNLELAATSIRQALTDYIAKKQIVKANTDDISKAASTFKQALKEGKRIVSAENRTWLELFITNDLPSLIKPLVVILQKQKTTDVEQADKSFNDAKSNTNSALTTAIVVIVLGLIIAGVWGYLVYQSIITPTERLSTVVKAISGGEYTLRTNLESTDELGQLGVALDALLDERLADLATVEEESEQLNESVIGLLMTVSKLSERDLTVQAMVTEDATGPVADALNLMTLETAEVLTEVTNIATVVQKASNNLTNQALKVKNTGAEQQTEISHTAESLANASKSLNLIADVASKANNLADNTVKTTKNSAKTVISAAESMGNIRDTIQETGKRIKRLSERTQEISGIVDVINNIAERTTVLALNASMQAAAAGEAGRGFAVVADEVQRLAESSRQATSQIETLIKNIVVETNETMSTMEKTIGQVINGTKLAEKAGQEMTDTLASTEDLVVSVAEISEGSRKQSVIAEGLLERAENIRTQSDITTLQLQSQLEQTSKLASYAKKLVDSVAIFKLPASSK